MASTSKAFRGTSDRSYKGIPRNYETQLWDFFREVCCLGAASRREAVLMHAVARLALHPLITNVQTSWVKMGPDGAALCLNAGANDLGGTLMNESISRAAGTQHGQEFPPEAMEALIRAIGRVPLQRDTLYRPAPSERHALSFNAPELAPVVQTPPHKALAAE